MQSIKDNVTILAFGYGCISTVVGLSALFASAVTGYPGAALELAPRYLFSGITAISNGFRKDYSDNGMYAIDAAMIRHLELPIPSDEE